MKREPTLIHTQCGVEQEENLGSQNKKTGMRKQRKQSKQQRSSLGTVWLKTSGLDYGAAAKRSRSQSGLHRQAA